MWEKKKGREEREKISKGFFFLFSFFFGWKRLKEISVRLANEGLTITVHIHRFNSSIDVKFPWRKKRGGDHQLWKLVPFFLIVKFAPTLAYSKKSFFFLPRPHKLTKQSFPTLLLSPLFSLAENCFPAKRNSNGFSSLSLSLSINLRVFAGIFVS